MDTTPLQDSLSTSTDRTPYARPSRAGTMLRRFVFTLNNWTQEEYEKIKNMKCQWMIIGKEVGEQGTPHLQGACILGSQMSFSQVKTLIGSRAHIASMAGTPEQNIAYCSKEDLEPFVKGTLPTQGKRTDLHSVTERVLAGESLRSLAQDEDIGAIAIVKFHKGLTILRSLTRPPRTGPPKVFWLHGSTGTGKTRSCFDAGKLLVPTIDDIWISSGGLRWFDGYDGQPVAILDDFRSKHVVNFAFLLRLLDRYPFDVEFKGGFVKWTASTIFITCPDPPDVCFAKRLEHVPEDIAQLHRRITKVFDMDLYYGEEERGNLVSELVELSRRDEENNV